MGRDYGERVKSAMGRETRVPWGERKQWYVGGESCSTIAVEWKE